MTDSDGWEEDSEEPSVGDVIDSDAEGVEALEGLGRQLLAAGETRAGRLARDAADEVRRRLQVRRRPTRRMRGA